MPSDDRSLREKGDAGNPITFDSSPETSPVARGPAAGGAAPVPGAAYGGAGPVPSAAPGAAESMPVSAADPAPGVVYGKKQYSSKKPRLTSGRPIIQLLSSTSTWRNNAPSFDPGSAGAASSAPARGRANRRGAVSIRIGDRWISRDINSNDPYWDDYVRTGTLPTHEMDRLRALYSDGGDAGATGSTGSAGAADFAGSAGAADFAGSAGAAGSADFACSAGAADFAGSAGAADFAGSAGAADFAGSAGAAGSADFAGSAPRRQVYVGGGGAGFMPYDPSAAGDGSGARSSPPADEWTKTTILEEGEKLRDAYRKEKTYNDKMRQTRKIHAAKALELLRNSNSATQKAVNWLEHIISTDVAWQMSLFNQEPNNVKKILQRLSEDEAAHPRGAPRTEELDHSEEQRYREFLLLFPRASEFARERGQPGFDL